MNECFIQPVSAPFHMYLSLSSSVCVCYRYLCKLFNMRVNNYEKFPDLWSQIEFYNGIN